MTLQFRTKNLDRSDISAQKANFEAIPIVDISGLYSPHLPDRLAVAEAIGQACRTVGFFYIKNHRVPQELVKAVYRAADEFYSLPLDEKQRYNINQLGRHRGYVPIGDLTADLESAFDLHEGYEISLELPDDDPDYLAGNIMYGPNVWPDRPEHFRSTVYSYYEAILELGQLLFEGFALSLGLSDRFFDDKITKPMAQLRVLHYPPQTGKIDPNHIGVGAHTDYECFTILAQSAPGLQVQNSLGEWIEAPPIPGTFVINIGDIMARWTNDIFTSTIHRVINSTGEKRFSLPFFFGANHNALIECLPTCHSKDSPPRYAPTTAGEWTIANITAAYSYRKP